MNKQGLRYTVMYSIVQGFFWINFVFIMGYSSVYMLDRGLSNSQIGLIVGGAGILAAVTQPLVAAYADKPHAPALKRIVAVIVLAAVCLAVLLRVTHGSNAWVSGLLFGSAVAFLQFLLPFINSLGTEMMDQGIKLNWGVARGIGSAFYVAASSIMGIVVSKAGAISIPTSIIIGYGLLLLGVLIYPFKKDPAKIAGKQQHTSSAAAFIRKYPRFFIMLIGMVCIYMAHAILNTFLYQIVQSKGGDSKELGMTMSICAAVELPPLFFFSLMLKKMGSDKWLRFCGIVMAVKAVGTFLVPNIGGLYAVSVLQMLGWAIIAIAPVYYVNKVIGHEDAIKGQAYMGMTYTVGNVVASFAGGWLLDIGGVSAMLVFCFVTAILGAALVFIFSDRIKEK